MTFRSVGVAVARLQIDVDVHLCRRRRRAADDPQIAEARAHPFAAHVELRRAVVDRRHHALEPQAADHHAVAHVAVARPSGESGGTVRALRFGAMARAATTASTAARASVRAAPVSPVLTTCRAAASCASARVFAFSSRDHVVDLASRLAHLRSSSSVSLRRERLFALLERLFALAHPRFVGLERFPLARRQPVLVLERAHVAIDLRQVLGELRFARAQVLPRRRDDRRAQPQPGGDFEREAAPRRAVDQLRRSARTSRDRSRTPPTRRRASSTRRS